MIFTTSIFANYISYREIPAHASSLGFASLGVVNSEQAGLLYSNPSSLGKQNRIFMDGGIRNSYSENHLSPTGFQCGFYIPESKKLGWGASMYQRFAKDFPASENTRFYQSNLFFTYRLTENLSTSIGIGPTLIFRKKEQSSYSAGARLSLQYNFRQFIFGSSFVHSGMKHKTNSHRQSDQLTERFSDTLAVGMGYQSNLHYFSIEAIKNFYEKSYFRLNGDELKPNLERGFGAEASINAGYQYHVESLALKIRSGVQSSGFYTNEGKNIRLTGFGFGVSWTNSLNSSPKSWEIHFGILDYTLLNQKKSIELDTLLQFSLTKYFL